MYYLQESESQCVLRRTFWFRIRLVSMQDLATFFIQKGQTEFKSSIWVEKDERRVNAKSLLGVLSLGIVGGTTIRIIADGAG